MDMLLTALRAAAETTRLRLLALANRGSFCVTDFAEILGQSQPRLSRHLKLLCESGLLSRAREGSTVWFSLPPDALGDLARTLVERLPEDDPLLASDRRQAARVLAERARVASAQFRLQGEDWDEMQALGLPAARVEAAIEELLGGPSLGRVLDIGTGTGRLLELLAPRASSALGIDASRAMLGLARGRLASPGLQHCGVRQADMYRLPLADASYDVAILQMVLHYAEDPAAALREAARVLRPGGRLLVIDLAAHERSDLTARLAHVWPGFSGAKMATLLSEAGLRPSQPARVEGPLEIMLWPADAPQTRRLEAVA